MGVLDEAGYLVTPREFERRMADIVAEKAKRTMTIYTSPVCC